MKYDPATIVITLLGLATAAPLVEREVPQEHSHEEILLSVDKSLKLDNPDNIVNPVFGLLGDQAAAGGAGNIKNLDCLQRAIADRAFTNDKKAGNIDGMAMDLLFAALEKNTGAVGKASNTCKDPAVNPEINAISQHQDPAGTGAQESNKKIVLALAVQLAAIGADPQLAAKSATFAPGKLGDPTAAGNTCDDKDDKVGCIFTKKLIQVEATPEEIDAAVKDAGGNKNTASTGKKATDKAASSDKAASCDNKATSSDKAASSDKTTSSDKAASSDIKAASSNNKAASSDKKAATSDKKAAGAAASDDKATGNNVQTFTGDLGGPPPAVIETPGSDRPFSVNGNTFVGKGAALQRSCAIQNNACANDANSGGNSGFSVSDCGAQESECNAAATAATKRSVVGV